MRMIIYGKEIKQQLPPEISLMMEVFDNLNGCFDGKQYNLSTVILHRKTENAPTLNLKVKNACKPVSLIYLQYSFDA